VAQVYNARMGGKNEKNDPLPPGLLKQWLPGRDLAGGGQSRTLMVKHRETDREGVAKVMKKPVGRAPSGPMTKEQIAFERMQREIDVIKRIDHRNIVHLLDDGLSTGEPWYVSPLGRPLEDYWRERREQPAAQLFEEALGFIIELAGALKELHARGIVHRDIKPGNIIVMSDDRGVRPVLIDFGLVFQPDDERLTDVDGRAVVNNFASPPAAYYGSVDEPRPSWDVLGLAWVWAWMLGAGRPEYGRNHWRYHRFIADPRCERVRAVCAVASHEDTSPRDGGALLELLEKHRLMGAPPNRPTTDTTLLAASAIEALQAAMVQKNFVDAKRVELFEVTAAALAPTYDDVRARMVALAKDAAAQGLPVVVRPGMEGPVAGEATAREYLQCVAKDPSKRDVPLFHCDCGEEGGPRFHVFLIVHLVQEPPGLVARARLARFHNKLGASDQLVAEFFEHTAAGALLWNGQHVESTAIVDLFARWLFDTKNWGTA
jgi:hypothetical protein